MAEISVSIPNELKKEIEKLNIDVSKIVAESVKEEIVKFIALKILSEKSKLSEEEAIELGRRLKSNRAKEFELK